MALTCTMLRLITFNSIFSNKKRPMGHGPFLLPNEIRSADQPGLDALDMGYSARLTSQQSSKIHSSRTLVRECDPDDLDDTKFPTETACDSALLSLL